MAKRRIYPLPVEELLMHPIYLRMSPAARGSLWSLVGWLWLAECPEIPTNPSELYSLARPQPKAWNRYKAEILQVLRDVAPGMRAYLNLRKGYSERLTEMGQKGGAITRLHALRKKRPRDDGPAAPVREANPAERPARPEERGTRARFGP